MFFTSQRTGLFPALAAALFALSAAAAARATTVTVDAIHGQTRVSPIASVDSGISPPSEISKPFPERDEDTDGLSYAEEMQRGSDPDEEDTDDDGVPDAADGWPRHAWITAPPLPEVRYAVLPLRTLGLPDQTIEVALAQDGSVLYSEQLPSESPGSGQIILWPKYRYLRLNLAIGVHATIIEQTTGRRMSGSDYNAFYQATWRSSLDFHFPTDWHLGFEVFDSMGAGHAARRLGNDSSFLNTVWNDGEAMAGSIDASGQLTVYPLQAVSLPSGDGTRRIATTLAKNKAGDVAVLDGGSSLQIRRNPDGTYKGFAVTGYAATYLLRADGTSTKLAGELGKYDESPPRLTSYSGSLFIPSRMNEAGSLVGLIQESDAMPYRSNNPQPVSPAVWNGTLHRSSFPGGVYTKILDATSDRPALAVASADHSPGFQWIFLNGTEQWATERFWDPAAQRLAEFRFIDVSNDMEFIGHSGNGPAVVRNGVVRPLQGAISEDWQVTSLANINDKGLILAHAKHTDAAPPDQQLAEPVLLIPASLAVDSNRDGVVDDSDMSLNSQTTPFMFWVNDDNDTEGAIDGNDIPGQPDNQINLGQNADYSPQMNDGSGIGQVDGVRDLVDFFPVFLDVKQLLAVLPPSASIKYKLKHGDGALNFVYTKLNRADALKYQTEDRGAVFGNSQFINQSIAAATTYNITNEGHELSSTFLDGIRDQSWGVILIEGRAPTDKPLVLSVEKVDGTVIAQVSLNIKISPVETMFRHLNLHERNLAGLVGSMPGGAAQSEAMDDPAGFPDNPNSDSRWLIFVHGFNVSGQGSRGWNAEMFKRCYWSGNKSRFVGVSYFGNPDQVLGAISDFSLAMRNAMVTAPVLAQEINALPGAASTKTMFAHSLGCGVISSAIADHGMNIGRACFVDAALALESFDGRDPSVFTSENDGMTPAVWKPYSPNLYAANWFARFDPVTDARGKLTWSNRFSGASSAVYNFYSSTEDVLAEYTGELPSTFGGILWNPEHLGTFGWVYQEKGKGNRQDYLFQVTAGPAPGATGLTHLGTYYGGWGMNLKDPALSGDTPHWKWVNSYNYIGRMIKAPAEIGAVSDSVLRRHPVFEPGWGVVRNQEQQESPVSNVSPVDGAPSWIYDLYLGTAGNTLAGDAVNRAQLLAEAIPSLTWCMGSHKSDIAIPNDRNFNLPKLVDQTNWPRGKPDGVTPEWRHSDMREVAYLYQYGVFDKIIAISKP